MGRQAGLPKVPGSGRVKSSLDKNARQLVSAQLAHGILATFEMLGGTAAMVEWAADNKTVFYTQILSRLMPAPQKEPDVEINIGPSASNMTDREAAISIAFVLNKAMYENDLVPVAERVPPLHQPVEPEEAYINPNQWMPGEPTPAPPTEPVEDPAKTLWVQELSLTAEQRRDQALVRNTREASLETYAGGAEQQGYGPVRQSSSPRARESSGELCRRLSRRGRELL
jgi:hypothetical protein